MQFLDRKRISQFDLNDIQDGNALQQERNNEKLR